ncbi:MAG TPA: transposase [Anaerolineales bacterium]|jgi:REP element-mobilizing transposase RayT
MPKFDPKIHHRHSIRLPGYDYSRAGAYYVTIVTHGRENLFGEVLNGVMELSRYGQIVQAAWFDLPKHYRHLELDAFCIMPNHVHAILVLIEFGRDGSISDNDNMHSAMPAGSAPLQNRSDTRPSMRQPLTEIVRAFKSFSARRINELRKTPGIPVWQRNYYEHIIRDNEDYLAKYAYIRDNPMNLEKDGEYST